MHVDKNSFQIHRYFVFLHLHLVFFIANRKHEAIHPYIYRINGFGTNNVKSRGGVFKLRHIETTQHIEYNK